MKVIAVVAGIIFNQEGTQVLLALRKPGQHQGGLWEFPGGKKDSGESLEQALARELLEEIGIVPVNFVERTIIEHRYAEKQVRLHFWDVTRFTGIPRGREGQILAWFELPELAELSFPAANQAIVEALLASSR